MPTPYWRCIANFSTPSQVLEICAHFGGLQAARTEMMGLFVYDLGPIDEDKVCRGYTLFAYIYVLSLDRISSVKRVRLAAPDEFVRDICHVTHRGFQRDLLSFSLSRTSILTLHCRPTRERATCSLSLHRPCAMRTTWETCSYGRPGNDETSSLFTREKSSYTRTPGPVRIRRSIVSCTFR